MADGLLLLPYNFHPRSYQHAFVEAMQTHRNAILVWHRRAGKDKTTLNYMIAQAWGDRVGVYYYFFPTYAQGKKIIWDGIDGSGFPFRKHFPPDIVADMNENEMQVTLRNGSIIQIIGTDKIDSIVGTNPVGCVFSEYALQNTRAYDFVRPILAENKGWAVFCYTPRGKNHGYKLWQAAQKNPDWYVSLLTVDDTHRDSEMEDGSPVMTPKMIADERSSGMSEALIQQEFYCSFEGQMEGSYYGDLIQRAEAEGRFLSLDAYFQVLQQAKMVRAVPRTGWDLGIDDSTAIIFEEKLPNGAPLITGYYENHSQGLEHYRDVLRNRHARYDLHFWPWDAKVTEWGTGKTRYQTAVSLGFQSGSGLGPIYVLPKVPNVADAINAVRQYLAKCFFLKTPEILGQNERPGLRDILVGYRRVYDEEKMVWAEKPLHDWTSHGADACRSLAEGWHADHQGILGERAVTTDELDRPGLVDWIDQFRGPKKSDMVSAVTAETEFNPFTV